MFRSSVPVVLAVLVLASGCLGATVPPPSEAKGLIDALLAAGPLPPGCDGNVTSVSHHQDAAAAVATQVAVGCLSHTDSTGWEPTIGVHPKTGDVFVYPAQSQMATSEVRIARTKDQGATWEALRIGAAGQSTHPASLDPYMYLDPETGRIFAEDLVTAHCAVFSYSDDEGASWTTTASGCTQADHVNIFAGKPVTSTPIGYPRLVYRCGIGLVAVIYASVTAACQKSLNGGMTFVQTGDYPFGPQPGLPRGTQGVPGWCDGAMGHASAGPDGTLYVPKGVCGTPMLAISKDEGLTWTRVKVSDLGMMVAFCNNWDHEADVGVDADGNVYYGWMDNQRVPRIAVSRDGGRTFAAAFAVGPPGLTQAFMPTLAVGGVGKVAFSYMGSTTAPPGPFPKTTQTDPATCETVPTNGFAAANSTWDGFVTMSTDLLSEDPTFVSVTLNDPRDPLDRGACMGIACPSQGDFHDVRIAPDGTPWVSFIDGCQGSCVTGEGSDRPTDRLVAGRVYGIDLR